MDWVDRAVRGTSALFFSQAEKAAIRQVENETAYFQNKGNNTSDAELKDLIKQFRGLLQCLEVKLPDSIYITFEAFLKKFNTQ